MTPPPPAIITDSEEHALNVLTNGRKTTIRPRLRDAVHILVTEGLSIADSARRAGMTPHSLQVALKKPHVADHVSHVKRAWLENRTSKAWLNVAQLADSACSEDVRLKANRVFLEAAGELGAKGADPNAAARTLVQIVVNAAQGMGHLPASQMPGVIESPPYQPLQPDASNYHPVGREESGDE
jgi:hypothetical protein